jgi:hypothetical protein
MRKHCLRCLFESLRIFPLQRASSLHKVKPSKKPNPQGNDTMMTATQARDVIAEIERDVKSVSKRKRIAAAFATNIAKKLSAEAVEVYRAYSA